MTAITLALYRLRFHSLRILSKLVKVEAFEREVFNKRRPLVLLLWV